MSFKIVCAIFVAVGSLVAANKSKGNIVVVSQDPDPTDKYGVVQEIETIYGSVVIPKSNAQWRFTWPYVQITSNTKKNDHYLTTYPEGNPSYSGPETYLLDKDLVKTASYWANFSYFDLQWSNKDETVYGIYVSSTYGRVLTKYTLPTDGTTEIKQFQQLFTLPYMWYVNASSFDQTNNVYYALLNNFPGKTNSTLDQQLLIADLSKPVANGESPPVTVIPIDSKFRDYAALLQFIAYSDLTKTLFFAGSRLPGGHTEVGILNTNTGKVHFWACFLSLIFFL
jgi:hypothetical protein